MKSKEINSCLSLNRRFRKLQPYHCIHSIFNFFEVTKSCLIGIRYQKIQRQMKNLDYPAECILAKETEGRTNVHSRDLMLHSTTRGRFLPQWSAESTITSPPTNKAPPACNFNLIIWIVFNLFIKKTWRNGFPPFVLRAANPWILGSAVVRWSIVWLAAWASISIPMAQGLNLFKKYHKF